MKLNKILFSLLLFLTPLCASEKYTLSICALFRNEARFLKEWIEYHRIVGVEHFYLFNNLSEDDWEEVLTPYIEEGIVDLYDWPYELTSMATWTYDIQCRAYIETARAKQDESQWIAMIDTDEFLVPVETDDLREVLAQFEHYGGLYVNWQIYGTSGVSRIPDNQTMIGTLLYKAPTMYRRNYFVKTIVQPKAVANIRDPHVPVFKPGYAGTTPGGARMLNQSSLGISIDQIRINHYINRDDEFFYGEKTARYYRMHPKAKRAPRRPDPVLNQVEDPIMLRFVPELERRLF